jgi:hypothetical protein
VPGVGKLRPRAEDDIVIGEGAVPYADTFGPRWPGPSTDTGSLFLG